MSDFKLDMKAILNEYSDEVQKEVREVVLDVADDAAEKLREKTNGGSWKEYPRTWKATEETDRTSTKSIIHNTKHYRLAHLLEFGHAIKRGGRTVGEASAFPHIADVDDWAADELPKRIEREIGG